MSIDQGTSLWRWFFISTSMSCKGLKKKNPWSWLVAQLGKAAVAVAVWGSLARGRAPPWVGSKSEEPQELPVHSLPRVCGSGCELTASCSSDCCHTFLTTMASPSAAISQNKLFLAFGPGNSGEQQKSDRYTWVPGSKLKRSLCQSHCLEITT